MVEFDPRTEANKTRAELAALWARFQDYGREHPEKEAVFRLVLAENAETSRYGQPETEIALEAIRVMDFGFLLAMEIGGLCGDDYSSVPVILTNDEMLMKTLMGMDHKHIKTGAVIKASARSLIDGRQVSLTVAGIEYDQRRLTGRSVSAYLDDQLVIDLIFGTAEEYSHYCFYQTKSGEKIAQALLEYQVFSQQSTILENLRKLGESLVAYHSSILERRALIWKTAVAQRHFPSLFPYFMIHQDEVRSGRG